MPALSCLRYLSLLYITFCRLHFKRTSIKAELFLRAIINVRLLSLFSITETSERNCRPGKMRTLRGGNWTGPYTGPATRGTLHKSRAIRLEKQYTVRMPATNAFSDSVAQSTEQHNFSSRPGDKARVAYSDINIISACGGHLPACACGSFFRPGWQAVQLGTAVCAVCGIRQLSCEEVLMCIAAIYTPLCKPHVGGTMLQR